MMFLNLMNFIWNMISLRLFAKGKVTYNDNKSFQLHENDSSIKLFGNENLDYKNINPISLSGNRLIYYLKEILNIKEELKSDIFLVQDLNEKYYYLYLFKESKKYQIMKNETILEMNKGNFVLIDNYNEMKGNNIIFNRITQIKKLNEKFIN